MTSNPAPSPRYLLQYVLGAVIVLAALIGGGIALAHGVQKLDRALTDQRATACSSGTSCEDETPVRLVGDGQSSDGSSSWIVVAASGGGCEFVHCASPVKVPVEEDQLHRVTYPRTATVTVIDGRVARIDAGGVIIPTLDGPTSRVYLALSTIVWTGFIALFGVVWALAYIGLAAQVRIWHTRPREWFAVSHHRAMANGIAGVAAQDPAAFRRRQHRTDRALGGALWLFAGVPLCIGLAAGLDGSADTGTIGPALIGGGIGAVLTAAIVWWFTVGTKSRFGLALRRRQARA